MNRGFVRFARGVAGVPMLALAGAFMACSSASGPEVKVPNGAVSLEVRSFEDAGIPTFISAYGYPDRERIVIRTAAAWEEAWNRLTSNIYPKPPVPEVSFDSEMVILATMGAHPTGGNSIAVEEVAEDEGTVYVLVHETLPGANCITTQAVTAPATPVRVPRRDGPVVFLERRTTTDCRG
jgi:hypothetical protein